MVCTSLLSRSAPMCAFIPKYHWLPFRRLVHLRVTFPLRILGRGGRSNSPRAARSALTAVKRPLHKPWVSSRCRKFRRAVASGTPSSVSPLPLVEELDAQHPLQTDGRATALALGIMRLDDRRQCFPPDDFPLWARNFSRRVAFFLAANPARVKLAWWVMQHMTRRPTTSFKRNPRGSNQRIRSSARHQCAHLLAEHHITQIVLFEEVEYDDWHPVVHAHGKRGGVHHL